MAGVFISVAIAPPVLPVYTQPPCPGDGYIWTPGYWAYGPDGYYWVPGTWVLAPAPGLLWTPGYWGWGNGLYVWHPGYWGVHVGFYGGVNYGFGYLGSGYAGGYWSGRTFFYNRTVNNINITNVHIYNKTVINNNVRITNVSYNGGPGGIRARPSRVEERFSAERHFEPSAAQIEHARAAGNNRALLAAVNHGRPEVAATARPGEFHGRSTVPARPQPARPYAAENRAMRSDVPRPVGSERAGERPRPTAYENRGGRAYARPRMEDRPAHDPPRSSYGSDGARAPASYHGEAPQARERQPERAEKEGRGREQKPH
jgi:hypothetical protein